MVDLTLACNLEVAVGMVKRWQVLLASRELSWGQVGLVEDLVAI